MVKWWCQKSPMPLLNRKCSTQRYKSYPVNKYWCPCFLCSCLTSSSRRTVSLWTLERAVCSCGLENKQHERREEVRWWKPKDFWQQKVTQIGLLSRESLKVPRLQFSNQHLPNGTMQYQRVCLTQEQLDVSIWNIISMIWWSHWNLKPVFRWVANVLIKLLSTWGNVQKFQSFLGVKLNANVTGF